MKKEETEEDKRFQQVHAHFLMLKAYNALNDFVSYACYNTVFNERVKQAQEIRDAVSTLAHAIEKSIAQEKTSQPPPPESKP